MKKNTLTIAVMQYDIAWENPIRNKKIVEEKIKSLNKPIDALVLPEMFTTGFSMNTSLAENMNGETIQWMQSIAYEHKILLIGSLMINENKNFFNRLLCVKPDKKFFIYDKHHLFSIGDENKYFTAGNSQLTFEYNGWKIRTVICYDLRFPVWCRNQNAYDILIVVANWPYKRINAWKTLLAARAIENQCYVIGANRTGIDAVGIKYSGASQILDINGKNIIKATNENQIIIAELFLNKLIRYRKKFPVLNDADKFIIN